MTLKQKEIIRESAYMAQAKNNAKWLRFPRCINQIKSLNLTLVGKIILLAFDDASISLQNSTQMEDFCRKCCLSLKRRNVEPDWNFVAEIAYLSGCDMSQPQTIPNRFIDEFPC
jgi:hypothetical protein